MTSWELFSKAIEVVLAHEGGLVDHRNDTGGVTNYGISAAANPGVDIANLTREAAIGIYWTKYWEDNSYDLLPEAIATKTFDLAVNMGRHAAVTCLQRALRSCGERVDMDGVLGPQTAGAVEEVYTVCGIALLTALRSEAAGQYRVILARDPSQAVFSTGWIERAYS